MSTSGRSATTRRLILWDIDGTLLTAGRVGRLALEHGAMVAAGLTEVPLVVMSGKTDPQIVRELLEAAGLDETAVEAAVPPALEEAEHFLAGAVEQIRREGRVHPGVVELLGELDRTEGVRQSLLTGNIAPNAVVKVSAFSLERFFDFEIGAFGTDDANRDQLVPVALRRVRERYGEAYGPEEAWVIGDTAKDLSCARAGGVRCLLVGTGHDGFEAVRDLEADAVVEDLSDTAMVLKILLGG